MMEKGVPRVVVCRRGPEGFVLVGRRGAPRAAANRDADIIDFNIRSIDGDESVVSILFDGPTLGGLVHQVPEVVATGMDVRDVAAEYSLGKFLDDRGITKLLSEPYPSLDFDAWQPLSAAGDGEIDRYIADKVYLAWKAGLTHATFSIVDALRLGVPLGKVARQARLDDGELWSMDTPTVRGFALTPTDGFLRSRRKSERQADTSDGRSGRREHQPAERATDRRSEDQRYEVALSFAGENRAYVEEVARRLQKAGVNVFYDDFEQPNLWGKDLFDHLTDIYQNRADYTVMFISEHYGRKAWPTQERRSAQARAIREKREYILPARFDDTEVPGILSTTSYVDLRIVSPEQLTSLILQKVGRARTQLPASARNDVPHSTSAAKSREPEPVDKWVNLDYVERSGLTDERRRQGYRLAWVAADDEAMRVDIDGWEYVLAETRDGQRVRYKVRDAAVGYLVLLQKRET